MARFQTHPFANQVGYISQHGRFSQLSPMIFQRSPQYTLDIHITLHPYDIPLMVSFIPISHQISRGYPIGSQYDIPS